MLLQTWGAEAQGCTRHPTACRLLAATGNGTGQWALGTGQWQWAMAMGTGGVQNACRGFWDTIIESCMEVLAAHRERVR